MPVEKAKKLFLGIDCKNQNCYLSVVHAFQHQVMLHQDDLQKGLKFSAGRAPDGLCGAVYAVKKILEMHHISDSFQHFADYFIQNYGALKCKEIRSLKKIPCVKCVEEAATYLDQLFHKGNK